MRYIGRYIDEHVASETFREEMKNGIFNIEAKIKKYGISNSFPLHTDDSSISTITRRIAYILYLNSDFKGGDTIFKSGNEEIARIKPEEGSIAVFAVHPIFMHEGEEVTSGERYILNGFAHVLTSQIRAMSLIGGPVPPKSELVVQEIGTLAEKLKNAARDIF